MRNGLTVVAPALMAGLALTAAPAWAGSATGLLTATITISTDCHVSATSQVNFGTVDPTQAANASGTGSISVECTKGTTIADIKLDGGANRAGSSRQMANGGFFVAYALYADAAHTTPWGDGVTTGLGNPMAGGFTATTSAATPQTFSVYGLVTAAAEDVPAAAYHDTVNVTVDF